MSTIQPDLHKYFKVKKNLKEPGKSTQLSRESQSDDFKLKLNLKVNNLIPSVSTVHEFKNKQSQRIGLPHLSEATTSRTTECNLESRSKETKSKAKDIVTVTVVPSLKEEIRKSNAKETSINKTTQEAAENENDIFQLSLTPKRKSEAAEHPSKKRKRQQLEEDSSTESLQTPPDEGKKETSTSFMVLPQDKNETQHMTLSAKKRLVMEEVPLSQQVLEKPDPETMKRLVRCSRLDELRSHLLKLNQCEKKLQAFRSQTLKKTEEVSALSPPNSSIASPQKRDLRLASSPYKVLSPRKCGIRTAYSPRKSDELRLKSFSSLDIEVPISPKKSPAKVPTPVKSRQEYSSHLSELSGELYLPHRYQFVKEVFRAVDTVVSLLHNRQEVITFSKLKPSVQEVLRKTFLQTHLGQLKTVFPLAYFFDQEKLKSKNAHTCNSLTYELTVKPNLDFKKDVPVTRSSTQDLNNADICPKFRKMDSVVLVERRHIFHSALLNILKKRHEQFLQNLDPPIILEGPLRRWHPDFPIEDVPPPAPSPLPQLPSGNTIDTAKDVLEKAKEIFSVNNRMKEAITAAASVDAAGSSKIPTATQPQMTDKTQLVAALKGVSLSLLEKIRAREAVKATREMTRSVVASKELEMLSRLPELVRVLRSLFVTEKKAALPWDAVVAKVVSSHSGSLSASEAEKHLNMLMKEFPEWCTKHNVRSGIYIKIDKTRQLHEIIDRINAVIREKT